MHPDHDALALLALGETPEAAIADHVGSCAQCRAEVAQLGTIVAAARDDSPLERPPARVWQRIAAELELGDQMLSPEEAERPPARVWDRTAAELGWAPADRDRVSALGRVARAPRRRSPAQRAARGAAAAAVALVLLGVGVVIGRSSQSPSSSTSTVVASAVLAAQPSWVGANGTAEVRELPDGTRRLWIRLDTPAPSQGRREVWLATADLTGLQSLGTLLGAEGELNIPTGLDLSEFPVVDVSAEPVDDHDPAHSTDSISRGTLHR